MQRVCPHELMNASSTRIDKPCQCPPDKVCYCGFILFCPTKLSACMWRCCVHVMVDHRDCIWAIRFLTVLANALTFMEQIITLPMCCLITYDKKLDPKTGLKIQRPDLTDVKWQHDLVGELKCYVGNAWCKGFFTSRIRHAISSSTLNL